MFSYKEISKLSKDYPNDWDLAKKIRSMVDDVEKKRKELIGEDRYIYERNPDTGEIFRRKFGDYDSPRELISVEEFKNSNK
tara:strand:- start:368 stop:610 length:243 start_codon:yes stop_codon:yes gene_type:complete